MELVEVEITGQAITARYGTLNSGDILRTDKEFADHLVNDCSAAKYVVAKPEKPAAPPATKAKEKTAKVKPVVPPAGELPADPLPESPADPVVTDPPADGAGADVCTDPPAADPADAPQS
jgi:hypothetical protein